MPASAVLVTGARGFVGSWLAKALLERGERVVCLDRPRSDIDSPARPSSLALQSIDHAVEEVEADLRDGARIARMLADHGVDAVFHLAAQTIVGDAARVPAETFDVNVRGTWTLLEACRSHGVSWVVVASSDKAYGRHDELPYREDAPLRPTAPYEASKAAADVIARSYWPAHRLAVAVTRFANVYGGGDTNFSRLIPEAVCAALDGRSPVIRSDGSPQRDFLYVEDAVAAYLALADALAAGAGRGEAFNAGGGRPYGVRDVVDVILRLAQAKADPDVRGSGNPAGEIDRQFVDSTKLRELTGWRPEVALEEGLRRTIEWYRAHADVRPHPALHGDAAK